MKQRAVTKLKNKNGMTLLEVIVAVFVLAIVAVPLLNLFLNSTRYTTIGKDITNTTYSAQAKLEELNTKTYSQLFNLLNQSPAANPNHAYYNGKYYSIKAVPSGSLDKSLFSGAPCYAHFLINGSKVVFTGPDGKYVSGTLQDTSLTVSGGNYTISGSVSASGAVPGGKPLALIVNSGSASISAFILSLSGVAACAVYETPAMYKTSLINVTGISASKLLVYNSDNPPATVLVDLSCLMYKRATDVTPQSVSQNTREVSVP